MSIDKVPVSVGDVLVGKYRVERVLGMGNMGVVVEATNLGLEQRVALKFLLAHRATHQPLHDRFLREARASAQLKSQHVTRVMDVGTLDGGAPYMVMELLDGHDLAAELDQKGKLPVADAVEYVLQVCEAVGEAHRAGIVHRDLKPANLFLTRNADGTACIKVFDFGVSKVAGANQLKLTAEGQWIGSPLYMSPEQMMAKPDVDTRADIWALGVILFELIAGKTPFDAENLMGLQTNVLVKGPTPLTAYTPEAPAGLEAIILQCLDKDRDRRWPDVATFAAALLPFAPSRMQSYPARVAGMLGTSVAPSRPTMTIERARLNATEPTASVPGFLAGATTSSATSQPVRASSRPGRGVAAAAALLVTLALGAGVILRQRFASTPLAPSASSAPAANSAPRADEPSPSPPASAAATPTPAEMQPTARPDPPAAPTATSSARVTPAAPLGNGAHRMPAPKTVELAHPAPSKPDMYGGRK